MLRHLLSLFIRIKIQSMQDFDHKLNGKSRKFCLFRVREIKMQFKQSDRRLNGKIQMFNVNSQTNKAKIKQNEIELMRLFS